MKEKTHQIVRSFVIALVAACLGVSPAWAGPPLICHAFDIGKAKSLPWVSHDWNLNGGENYDTKNLIEDTIDILDRSLKSTLVHMETLRRATLYARNDPIAAKQLLLKLNARAETSENSAHPDAWALFDAGYLAETYQQWLGEGAKNPANGMDGYKLVKKALQLSGNDPQMELATALITLGRPGAAEHQEHAAKAIAGAKTDELLAQNLKSHFLGGGQTMADIISDKTVAKNR